MKETGCIYMAGCMDDVLSLPFVSEGSCLVGLVHCTRSLGVTPSETKEILSRKHRILNLL